jgi:hypothetical protein
VQHVFSLFPPHKRIQLISNVEDVTPEETTPAPGKNTVRLKRQVQNRVSERYHFHLT